MSFHQDGPWMSDGCLLGAPISTNVDEDVQTSVQLEPAGCCGSMGSRWVMAFFDEKKGGVPKS